MTAQEIITTLIANSEYNVIKRVKIKPVFYDDDYIYSKEIHIIIDLSKFTEDEKEEMKNIEEIKYNGDLYRLNYKF